MAFYGELIFQTNPGTFLKQSEFFTIHVNNNGKEDTVNTVDNNNCM